MTSHQTHGVQQLLMAEKRAADKVSEARRRKAQRLKKAKIEAQEEVERYRLEREQQLREFEKNHLDTSDDIAEKIRNETQRKIEQMDFDILKQIDKVSEGLLKILFNIKPETNVNFVKLED